MIKYITTISSIYFGVLFLSFFIWIKVGKIEKKSEFFLSLGRFLAIIFTIAGFSLTLIDREIKRNNAAPSAQKLEVLSKIDIFNMSNDLMMRWDTEDWWNWDGADYETYKVILDAANTIPFDQHTESLQETSKHVLRKIKRSYRYSTKLLLEKRANGLVAGDKRGYEISTSEAIGQLKDPKIVTVFLALDVLGTKTDIIAVNELIKVMDTDPSLFLRKTALDSFAKIMKTVNIEYFYDQSDEEIFNFDKAIKFWKDHKDTNEIKQKFKDS